MKSHLRDAFEQLDPRPRSILERILFAGETCSQIARSGGMPPCDVRAAAISAMRSLRHAYPTSDGNDGLIALHALRALDADEEDVVRRAIASDASLQRRYAAAREVVGALCALWTLEPPPHLYRRLLLSLQATDRA